MWSLPIGANVARPEYAVVRSNAAVVFRLPAEDEAPLWWSLGTKSPDWSASDALVGLLAPCKMPTPLFRLREEGVPRGPE